MSTTRSAVGLRSERGPVLLAVMLCIGLVAIEATVIATAIPSIVADVGGFSQFPWLFSIFLLAQAVSVPIYGKLADAVGRKPVMLLGIALFVLGSLMCGVAWNMPALIVSRAVQGLGAGAIFPMTMTIVGDLYSVEERARVQGYVASVWGMASVVGPTIGGVFSEYATWRWIFFVNLPIGAFAAWMLWRKFDEKITRRRHSIDYTGAMLLTVGFSMLILALLEGGTRWGWSSPVTIGLLGAAAVALVAFVLVERKAAEPIVPMWVFSRRLLVGGNATSLLIGALMIGLVSYIPTYAQGVLGEGALVAGFALAAMTMGWPIAASLAGRVYMRVGFRDTSLIGTAFIITGALLVLTLGPGSSVWHVAAYCFVVGLGFGFTASPTLVAVQSYVTWEFRGVVTGTNMFARSLGSALGIAVFGATVNASLARSFANPPSGLDTAPPETADDAVRLLADGSGAGDAVREFVRTALDTATHGVFIGVAIAAVVMVGAVLLMPRQTQHQE